MCDIFGQTIKNNRIIMFFPQVARLMGCSSVIGICGSDAKCSWLTEDLGFDNSINYRTEDVGARLGALCPKGVHVYFDNVGGPISDDVINQVLIEKKYIWNNIIYGLTNPAYNFSLGNFINRHIGLWSFECTFKWNELHYILLQLSTFTDTCYVDQSVYLNTSKYISLRVNIKPK